MLICRSVKFCILLFGLFFSSVVAVNAGVEEESWYKISVSYDSKTIDVGYAHEQVSSVEAPHGKIWETALNLIAHLPDAEGRTMKVEIEQLEVSDKSGNVMKSVISFSLNGNLESREKYLIKGEDVIYEIESLEDGKESGTFILPESLLSSRVIEGRLTNDTWEVGGTLKVVELPSSENFNDAKFWGKYHYEGIVPVKLNEKQIRLRKFRYEGGSPGETYYDLNGDVLLFTTLVEGLEFKGTRTTKDEAKKTWLDQAEDAKVSRRVADALNLLASYYFVIENTKRFDYVDSAIVNNVLHDRFPGELEDILKRLIHLCEQGRIALESEGLVDNEHQRKLNATAMNFGARAGTALAMEDPVSLVFSAFEAYQEVQKADDEKSRKMQAVYQQYQHRVKVDKYELSTLRDKLQKKYDIPANYLVTYEALEEIHKASTELNPQSRIQKLSNLAEKYPRYGPLSLAIATALFYSTDGFNAELFGASLLAAVDNPNVVLRADPTTVNALQIWGMFTMINAWHQTPIYPDLKAAGVELEMVALMGLEIDPSISEFHLFKGVSMLLKDSDGAANVAWDLMATRSADIADINLQMLRYQWAIVFMGTDESNRPDAEYRSAIKTLFSYGFADIESLIESAGIKRATGRDKILRDEVRPKFSWGISDDWLWDDITLKNESPFPLTNVKIKVTHRNADSIAFRSDSLFNMKEPLMAPVVKEFKCDRIEPNSSHVWKDVLKKSEGEWNTKYSGITLSCDQGKGELIED